MIQRFTTDNKKLQEMTWTVSGRVIGYGQEEKTCVSLYAHNDQKNGVWSDVRTSVCFNLRTRVIFNKPKLFVEMNPLRILSNLI